MKKYYNYILYAMAFSGLLLARKIPEANSIVFFIILLILSYLVYKIKTRSQTRKHSSLFLYLFVKILNFNKHDKIKKGVAWKFRLIK